MATLNNVANYVKPFNSHNISPLNLAIHRAYAKIISLKMDNKLGKIELSNITNEYVMNYGEFINSFKAKVEIFADDAMDPNIIDKYLNEMTKSCFMRNQLAFLQQVIVDNEHKLTEQTEQLKSHQLVLNALYAMYEEIESVFNSLREDIGALEMIEQKISHSLSYNKYLVQDDWLQKRSTMADINVSISHLDDSSTLRSFNSSSSCGSDQHVLCSTKLDIESGCSATVQQQRSKRNFLAQYVAEVGALVNMPVNHDAILSAEK